MGYLEEVADRFIERRGGALFLSHRDYERILSWEERGIPPEVVLRAIDETFADLRGPDGKLARPVRSLAYLEKVILRAHQARRKALSRRDLPEEERLSPQLAQGLPELAREVAEALDEMGVEAEDPERREILAGLEALHQQARDGDLEDYDGTAERLRDLDDRFLSILRRAGPEDRWEEARRDARQRLAEGGGQAAGARFRRAWEALTEELVRRRSGVRRIALYALLC